MVNITLGNFKSRRLIAMLIIIILVCSLIFIYHTIIRPRLFEFNRIYGVYKASGTYIFVVDFDISTLPSNATLYLVNRDSVSIILSEKAYYVSGFLQENSFNVIVVRSVDPLEVYLHVISLNDYTVKTFSLSNVFTTGNDGDAIKDICDIRYVYTSNNNAILITNGFNTSVIIIDYDSNSVRRVYLNGSTVENIPVGDYIVFFVDNLNMIVRGEDIVREGHIVVLNVDTLQINTIPTNFTVVFGGYISGDGFVRMLLTNNNNRLIPL